MIKRYAYLRNLTRITAFWALLCFHLAAAALISADSASSLGLTDSVKRAPTPIRLSVGYPLRAGVISAIVPGAGQFSTGNYVKSGLFFTAEGVLGTIAYYQYELGKDFQNNSRMFSDSLKLFGGKISSIRQDTVKTASGDSVFTDTIFRSTNLRMHLKYSSYLEKENRYVFYQSALWMAGIYYWNILDAMKNTRYFSHNDPKDPVKAGWLSAIPVLGLGQLYNGELSKAGMIFATQLNMVFMVYNYNDCMRTCESNIQLLNAPGSKENKDPDAAALLSNWNSKRNDAFRNRNMWAWYSIVFYLYGILDAVVDAHLHDASAKMKLEPDLISDQKKVGINLKMNF